MDVGEDGRSLWGGCICLEGLVHATDRLGRQVQVHAAGGSGASGVCRVPSGNVGRFERCFINSYLNMLWTCFCSIDCEVIRQRLYLRSRLSRLRSSMSQKDKARHAMVSVRLRCSLSRGWRLALRRVVERFGDGGPIFSGLYH